MKPTKKKTPAKKPATKRKPAPKAGKIDTSLLQQYGQDFARAAQEIERTVKAMDKANRDERRRMKPEAVKKLIGKSVERDHPGMSPEMVESYIVARSHAAHARHQGSILKVPESALVDQVQAQRRAERQRLVKANRGNRC